LGHAAPDLATLRDTWRLHSLASGWYAADDWHNRAVDAVAGAMLPGAPPADLVRACGELGRARARRGIGVSETIADLAALYAVLGRGTPPLHLVSSLAEGWAEEGLAGQARGRCEDPLTGLTTIPYLRTRLAEVYRAAEQPGTSPAGTHRLVVVSPATRPAPGRSVAGRADPWHRLAAGILLGHDLRAAFPGGDTLAWSPVSGAGIALVSAHAEMVPRYLKLRRIALAGYGAQTRMTALPALLTEALRRVDELAQ
jgi:hypothetical protein